MKSRLSTNWAFHRLLSMSHSQCPALPSAAHPNRSFPARPCRWPCRSTASLLCYNQLPRKAAPLRYSDCARWPTRSQSSVPVPLDDPRSQPPSKGEGVQATRVATAA
eukprot:scaffold7075_cov274-Pinguiococcus_pyrenoidosus.AAC.10